MRPCEVLAAGSSFPVSWSGARRSSLSSWHETVALLALPQTLPALSVAENVACTARNAASVAGVTGAAGKAERQGGQQGQSCACSNSDTLPHSLMSRHSGHEPLAHSCCRRTQVMSGNCSSPGGAGIHVLILHNCSIARPPTTLTQQPCFAHILERTGL